MALWYTETYEDHTRYGLKILRTLHSSKSEYQTIELFETAAMGKTLALDGLFQTSEGDEYLYHEMIVHPALCAAAAIEDVLVIGGGDGGSAREVLRHKDVKRCTMVEIDAQVVAVCKEHIPHFGAWDDPRLELRIEDGIAFAKNAAPDSFDVVILDNSDPVGPSEGLFNREFYQSIKACLRPGGVFALQSESPLLMADLFDSIQRELSACFSKVAPCFGPVPIYGASQWSWTLASENCDVTNPIESRVETIVHGTRYYNLDIHRGAFAVPNDIARRLAAPATRADAE